MSEDAVSCRLDRIRALNDGLRADLEDGEWVLTDGIAGLSNVLALKTIHAVRTFAGDNVLQGEHDFGVVTVHDVTAAWRLTFQIWTVFRRLPILQNPSKSDIFWTRRRQNNIETAGMLIDKINNFRYTCVAPACSKKGARVDLLCGKDSYVITFSDCPKEDQPIARGGPCRRVV